MDDNKITRIGDLFGSYTQPPQKRKRASERGDLLDFFFQHLQPAYDAYQKKFTKPRPLTIKHLAFKVSHLKTPDLYYMKSVCLDATRRGGSFSKSFWGSLKVDNRRAH